LKNSSAPNYSNFTNMLDIGQLYWIILSQYSWYFFGNKQNEKVTAAL